MCAARRSAFKNKAAIQVLDAFAHHGKTIVGPFWRGIDIETRSIVFDLNLYIAPAEKNKQSDFSRIRMPGGIQQSFANHHQ